MALLFRNTHVSLNSLSVVTSQSYKLNSKTSLARARGGTKLGYVPKCSKLVVMVKIISVEKRTTDYTLRLTFVLSYPKMTLFVGAFCKKKITHSSMTPQTHD